MSQLHTNENHHIDDAHHEEGGHAQATVRGYVTGFILSVILTAIPFWLIMGKVIANPGTAAAVILAFAAVQILVHMVYFLHMNTKSEGGWNMLALIFTLVLVVITLAGSMWVMHHMNANMMPASMHDMRNMP
ncbi:MAG: cytochrome o ubiquinol oxidase subunit IV [Proteobacteria bacterium]|nr:cytochrome o ubiquinol oxidase subunit IV [Pseudomonadota bacterium]